MALVGVCIVLLFAVSNGRDDQNLGEEDKIDRYFGYWPSFTMTIRVNDFRFSERESTVYLLRFKNDFEWCIEIVSQSPLLYSAPDLFLPCGDEAASGNRQGFPLRWIRPSQAPSWLDPNASLDGVGLATASKEEILRGQSGEVIEVYREELTYRRMEGIPVKWRVTSNGRELERAEVLDLQISQPQSNHQVEQGTRQP